jgi:hypothetical protein
MPESPVKATAKEIITPAERKPSSPATNGVARGLAVVVAGMVAGWLTSLGVGMDPEVLVPVVAVVIGVGGSLLRNVIDRLRKEDDLPIAARVGLWLASLA